MNRNDYVKILNGDVERIGDASLWYAINPSEYEILIEPKHVRRMLLRFLHGNLTAEEITKWAKFINLHGTEEYTCVKSDVSPLHPKYDEIMDRISDYYQELISVIQRLSTPEIDGAVNKDSVTRYLSELEKYKNDANYEDDKTSFFS